MNWPIVSNSDPLSLCLTRQNFMMPVSEAGAGIQRSQNEPLRDHALDHDPLLRTDKRLGRASRESRHRTLPPLLAAGFRADLPARPLRHRRAGSYPGFFHDTAYSESA